jgi:hypothetical protein
VGGWWGGAERLPPIAGTSTSKASSRHGIGEVVVRIGGANSQAGWIRLYALPERRPSPGVDVEPSQATNILGAAEIFELEVPAGQCGLPPPARLLIFLTLFMIFTLVKWLDSLTRQGAPLAIDIIPFVILTINRLYCDSIIFPSPKVEISTDLSIVTFAYWRRNAFIEVGSKIVRFIFEAKERLCR